MGGGIMKEFVVLRPKIYSYLTENGYAHRNAKGTKKCVIKHKIKFEDYKNRWRGMKQYSTIAVNVQK